MFKYVQIEYMLAGASERPASGQFITTCFSRSPRRACALQGDVTHRLEGTETTPIMGREQLWKGARLIFDRWT